MPPREFALLVVRFVATFCAAMSRACARPAFRNDDAPPLGPIDKGGILARERAEADCYPVAERARTPIPLSPARCTPKLCSLALARGPYRRLKVQASITVKSARQTPQTRANNLLAGRSGITKV
jgi:hypothetical protein